MKSISEAEFLQWAATKGLRPDPLYPQSAVLKFHDALEDARFWEVPFEPHRRPHFIQSLLELLGDWQLCYVWRHMGSWPASVDPLRINDVVEFQILRGLGLPLGTADVVEFSRKELDKLVTLLFSTTVFGWSVREDLYVVPDHARAMLQTDHHRVIHAICREFTDVQHWVTKMAHAGFSLPEAVPDPTFKIPSWMTRDGG
jgi:hypothetical protein